jgi:hypothetical protein
MLVEHFFEMADETPPESILPDELVRRIADAVREALTQHVNAHVHATAAVAPSANVYRPRPSALSTSQVSVTPQLIEWALNNFAQVDPVEAERFWQSELGQRVTKAITDIVIQLIVLGIFHYFVEQPLLEEKERESQEFLSSLVTKVEKQVEGFWLAHEASLKPEPTPSPQPTPKHLPKRKKKIAHRKD